LNIYTISRPKNRHAWVVCPAPMVTLEELKKKSFATWTFALNDDVWHSVSARPLSTLLHFSPVNIGWITKQIKSQTRIV
jgi:hypothetical protein